MATRFWVAILTKVHMFLRCLLIFIFTNSIYSQSFEGVIKDSINKEPLVYANLTLLNRNIGTSTNGKGEFYLDVNKYNNNDTLLVSYVGYKSLILPLRNYKKNNKYKITLCLLENKAEIDEVIIKVKRQKYTLAKHNKIKKKMTKFGTSVQFGMENCVLIKNKKNVNGKVNKVSFYLAENNYTTFRCYPTYYRVKFYEYDVKKKQPGRLLSCYPNIIYPKGNSKEKITIDLTDHYVLYPESGLCVGIETVNPKPKRKINNIHSTYPNLTWTYDDEPLTWHSYRGRSWVLKKSKLRSKGLLTGWKENFSNPIIDVIVQYRK